MASFVESATLVVRDQATGPIRKINAELKKLQATANSIKSTKIDFKIDASGISKATAELSKLAAQLKAVKSNAGIGNLGNIAKGVTQLGDAIKKTSALLVPQMNKETAAVKAATEQVKDKAAADKAAIPLAIAAGQLTQKETALQKAQAKAIDQLTKAKAKELVASAKVAAQTADQQKLIAKSAGDLLKKENELQRARDHAAKNFKNVDAEASAQRTLAQRLDAVNAQRERHNNLLLTTEAAARRMEEVQPKRTSVPSVPRGGGRPPPAQPPVLAPSGSGAGGVLRTAGGYMLGAAGIGTLHEIGKEIRAGMRVTEAGEASLALKHLTPVRRYEVNELISQIGKEQAARPGGAMFQRGAITDQMSEMLGTLNIGSAKTQAEFEGISNQAKFMSDQNLELAATLVKLGKSSEDAMDDAVKYGKAIDQQGTAYDRATGRVDTKKLSDAYDRVRQLIPAVGKEMTGANFLAVQKYLRLSKFALSPEATAITMKSFEEMGTGAAVGMNQMIKSLGATTKAGLAEQFRLGLIQGHVEPGKVGKGGKRGKGKLMWDGVSDEDAAMIREHPEEWASTRLVPALINDLMKNKGLTREAAEKKTLDPTYIGDALNKIFPNRTAAEMAGILALQRNEIQQFLADWRSRSGDMMEQREDTKFNLLGTTAAMNQQMQGIMGSTLQLFGPQLAAAGQGLASTMQSAADHVDLMRRQGAKPGDIEKWVGTAGIASLIAGYAAKSTLPGLGLSAMATPLAYAAGAQGLYSKDPAVRGLSGSALALVGAADALKSAAAMQQTAAAMNALGALGVVGKAAAGALGIWQMLPDEVKDKMTQEVKDRLGIVPEKTPEEKQKALNDEALNDALGQRAEAQKALKSLEAGRATEAKDLRPGGTPPVSDEKIKQKMFALNDVISDLEVKIDELQRKGATPHPLANVPPSTEDRPLKLREEFWMD